MDTHLLAGLATFALVSSITPGPNNLMLLASGANFGFRRTLPHMLGIAIGFTLMIVLVGIGLIEIFDRYPLSHTILKIASVCYLVYLAWRIATASAPESREATGKPFSFWQAAAFQWVNPKAWAMGLTAITVYTATRELPDIVLVALVFGAINLPSVGCWAWLGQSMQRVLTNATRLRWFNVSMAALLLASLYPVLLTS